MERKYDFSAGKMSITLWTAVTQNRFMLCIGEFAK
jgi:hypothetical protein